MCGYLLQSCRVPAPCLEAVVKLYAIFCIQMLARTTASGHMLLVFKQQLTQDRRFRRCHDVALLCDRVQLGVVSLVSIAAELPKAWRANLRLSCKSRTWNRKQLTRIFGILVS